MNNLNDQKIETEIELLKIERQTAKVRLYLDVSKAMIVFLGALVLFWFVQKPESIINRTASKETISRHRANLMLEWIKENDLQKQGDALSVIKAAYGESDNEWIRELERRWQAQAQAVAINKLLAQHKQLVKQRRDLQSELDAQFIKDSGELLADSGEELLEMLDKQEVDDIDIRKIATRNQITTKTIEIAIINDQLARYGVDIAEADSSLNIPHKNE